MCLSGVGHGDERLACICIGRPEFANHLGEMNLDILKYAILPY
jgi:hypothetical protein